MKKENITSSSTETKKLAEKIVKEILKKRVKKRAFVIGLEGELGSGKTTFIQGFAKGLGIKEKILSPTFVIMKKFNNFYHIDCYRVQRSKELLDLGFKEIISSPQSIVAVEWADKIKGIMPRNTLWINFKFIDEKKRKITLKD